MFAFWRTFEEWTVLCVGAFGRWRHRHFHGLQPLYFCIAAWHKLSKIRRSSGFDTVRSYYLGWLQQDDSYLQASWHKKSALQQSSIKGLVESGRGSVFPARYWTRRISCGVSVFSAKNNFLPNLKDVQLPQVLQLFAACSGNSCHSHVFFILSWGHHQPGPRL